MTGCDRENTHRQLRVHEVYYVTNENAHGMQQECGIFCLTMIKMFDVIFLYCITAIEMTESNCRPNVSDLKEEIPNLGQKA